MMFLIKNKTAFLLTVFFGLLNGLIFATPIGMSLITSQLNLFGYFLILYFLASLAPILIILHLIKGKKFIVAIVILPIIMAFSWGSVNYFFPPSPIPFQGEKVDEEVYFDFSAKNASALKNQKFCFKVFLPSYLPSSPYKMIIDDVYASTGSCKHQIVVVTVSGTNLIQVPKTYDFDFRKGFENLKALRDKALASSKISLNGNTAYETSTIDIQDGFSKGRLFYWEIDDTIIFLKWDPAGPWSEKTYIRVAESMKPIN